MTEKICKNCSYKYSDDFCMRICMYVTNNHSCKLWTDEPIEFKYERIYKLCKDYIELCEDWEKHQELKEKYPEHKPTLELMENNYEFFFNCCLNDLHREMSLWKTKR